MLLTTQKIGRADEIPNRGVDGDGMSRSRDSLEMEVYHISLKLTHLLQQAQSVIANEEGFPTVHHDVQSHTRYTRKVIADLFHQ